MEIALGKFFALIVLSLSALMVFSYTQIPESAPSVEKSHQPIAHKMNGVNLNSSL